MAGGHLRRIAITGLLLAGGYTGLAAANAGIAYDDKSDSKGPKSTEIDQAQHMHQNATRLEHTVYVRGEADVGNPPNIYFDTNDDQAADFKFRHARGQDEVVLLSDTERTRPAEVRRINRHGLSIFFQEGAIRTPSSYHWYVAYEAAGEVLDRAPDETWVYHDLEVHD